MSDLAEISRAADHAASSYSRHALNRPDSDPAEEEDRIARALCDADAIADWLCGTEIDRDGYDPNYSYRALYDGDALKIDYRHARNLSASKLLSLVFGLTPDNAARIAAANELADRYLRDRGLA